MKKTLIEGVEFRDVSTFPDGNLTKWVCVFAGSKLEGDLCPLDLLEPIRGVCTGVICYSCQRWREGRGNLGRRHDGDTWKTKIRGCKFHKYP